MIVRTFVRPSQLGSFIALASIVAGCSSADLEESAESQSAELRVCPVITACDAAPPPAERRAFRSFGSTLLSATSAPNHRGHDAFLVAGEEQWLIGKFAYGLFDKDLKNEDVDVYVLRNCGSTWEKLGTARTTQDDQHPTIDGVADDGGRIYFPVPAGKTLGEGRHRVRFVVPGDGTATEAFLEVVSKDTPIFVSDVDGTLTTSELAEVGGVFTGTLPDANANAAAALQALANKGYRPLYLTARAERGTERTREFLAARGFPPGIVQTSFSALGLNGNDAVSFKTAALARVTARGLGVKFGFGNTATDATAYRNTSIPSSNAFFFEFDAGFGVTIDDYAELGLFGGVAKTCQ
jgi:hypothetical protein